MNSQVRIRRSRGAVCGAALILLGLWGGLAPFVGPYFHFGFTPDKAWEYDTGRLYLSAVPGAAALLGGLAVILTRSRFVGISGGVLAALGGAWLIAGAQVTTILAEGDQHQRRAPARCRHGGAGARLPGAARPVHRRRRADRVRSRGGLRARVDPLRYGTAPTRLTPALPRLPGRDSRDGRRGRLSGGPVPGLDWPVPLDPVPGLVGRPVPRALDRAVPGRDRQLPEHRRAIPAAEPAVHPAVGITAEEPPFPDAPNPFSPEAPLRNACEQVRSRGAPRTACSARALAWPGLGGTFRVCRRVPARRLA